MPPDEKTASSIRFSKILLALDLSERTPELISTAAYVARSFGAEVVAAMVVKMPTSVRGDESDGFPAGENEEKLRESLTELLRQYFVQGSEIPVMILHGEPADRISEYAEYVSADLILIGSRGHGAVKRAILGSTSSAVASNSKTSVMILK